MLKNMSFLNMLVWNLVIAGLWHIVVFLVSIKLPDTAFDPAKERYAPKPWERGGRWYRDVVKIQEWKDRLPQHIGRDGFSKKHLTEISVDYLDKFIMETCRGEWVHLKDCACAIVTLLINPLLVGILVSFLIMLANVPFAAVQRYNRFRLQILRKRRLRAVRDGLEQNAVTA